ncbi:hypothetical protein, partial [Photobacterium leiognathi]|uniref:hypothetical protein n=1 Tax=Photobacterium leiognathi TaxID=553611 RepID=UPI002735DD09
LYYVQLDDCFNQVIPTSVSSFRIYRETLSRFSCAASTCFTHIEEMAQGLNNKVDFLFCFESIKLQDNKKSLMINIDKIVVNYRKRHQLK